MSPFSVAPVYTCLWITVTRGKIKSLLITYKDKIQIRIKIENVLT